MKTIVFLTYHGVGHFNAIFKLATIVGEKYHVVFAGNHHFKAYVSQQGFTFYPLQSLPFGLDFENWYIKNKTQKKWIYWDVLKARKKNLLFTLRKAELQKLITKIRPDYIFIDAFQATDIIAMYGYLDQIKVAFFDTTMFDSLRPNTPPANSLALPGQSKKINQALRIARWNIYRKKLSQQFFYFGMDDSTLIQNACDQTRFPHHFLALAKTRLGISFKDIPKFILAPLEFDLTPGQTPSHHQYLGFLTPSQRKETFDQAYLKAKDKLSTQKNKKIIYCAFGTIPPKNIKVIQQFLLRLFKALDPKKYCLFVALPAHNYFIQQKKIPSHIFILDQVPQLDMLGFTDVFITHGGLNSIKESIEAEVPMLVYPIDAIFDTSGNSSRVVYSGIGLRGSLKQDSSLEIETKVRILHTDPVFKKNLRQLKAIDNSYPEDYILQCMDTLKPIG